LGGAHFAFVDASNNGLRCNYAMYSLRLAYRCGERLPGPDDRLEHDMTQKTPKRDTSTILLVGVSRGLGLGLAREFAKRGWHVVATVRGGARTELHELADTDRDRIELETVDVAQPEQVTALRDRLVGRSFDVLFVNAGTANIKDEIAGEIATDEYARVLMKNALGPLRVIEACRDLVRVDGLIGIMSSGQHHEQYQRTSRDLPQQQGGPQPALPELRRAPCR
jgi:NAD(P)-dependent dehydrogenase (short-subunit alcohol dehydrogenase family)